jgi:hypothetical protein
MVSARCIFNSLLPQLPQGQPDNGHRGARVEFLLVLPASFKVCGAFAGILLLHRFGLPLGWSMLIATALLSLWSGTGAGGIAALFHSFLMPNNCLLMAVVLLLLLFTESLTVSGRLEKTVSAFRALFRHDRMLLGGLPALIGLLPMPGGALFSAPLVASADSGCRLPSDLKVAINYWFRHIWEFWWPLYPGVILALQYCALPAGLFFLIQAPFTLAAVAGGYLFQLRRVAKCHSEPTRTLVLRDSLSSLSLIGLLVAVSVTASSLLPLAGMSGTLANLLGMTGGLLIALAWIFFRNPGIMTRSAAMLRKSSTWSLMLVVAGALAFSAVLQLPTGRHGATLVSLMRNEFLSLGIPLVLVTLLIPFVSGMVTGIAVGFVGASFPIIFALLGPDPPLNLLLATTSLAYGAGFLGEMLSPVHICLVVTKEYFKSPLLPVYRYLLGPAALLAGTVAVLSCAYYFMFK